MAVPTRCGNMLQLAALSYTGRHCAALAAGTETWSAASGYGWLGAALNGQRTLGARTDQAHRVNDTCPQYPTWAFVCSVGRQKHTRPPLPIFSPPSRDSWHGACNGCGHGTRNRLHSGLDGQAG